MKEKKPNTGGRPLLIMVLSVVVMATAAGIAMAYIVSAQRAPALSALLLLPEPRPIAAFELVDGAGWPFSPERLRGHWSLAFFGFTNCPDVCPSALYDLDLASRRLVEANIGARAEARDGVGSTHQVVFVSVDPERDTPERIAQYVAYFNPGFIGVSGAHDQLAALTAQLGIAYRVEEHAPGSERYDVVHSASVVLIDPRGRLRGAFPPPLDAPAIARDLALLIDREG
jgi:protein SCO1/2